MAGREWRRGECQTRLGLVWREAGASARATVRAAAKRRPPEEVAVEKAAQPSALSKSNYDLIAHD